MTNLIYKLPIILASQSTARHNLLTQVKLEHEVVIPPIDEDQYKHEVRHFSIREQALRLAQLKANAVSALHPESLIIGADQIGESNGKALFKPQTLENNIAMLQKLNGQEHRQYTVTVLYYNCKEIHHIFSTVSLVMRKLSAEEITAYVDHDKPWHCCGGYRFEGLGKHLFERVDGDHDSVIGLSVVPLLAFLHDKGFLQIV